MKILITGGCGFLGSNLASYGLEKGYEITILDNLSRLGAKDNLLWLKERGLKNFVSEDIRNSVELEQIIKVSNFQAIFHLAGQVAMTTSIADPYKDFSINAIGTLNVLEAVRKYSPSTTILYSSTNKVYGDLEQYNYSEGVSRYSCVDFPNGFNEETPLNFQSPYGCSKGCADQYMLDYHRIFGLHTVVFRHSSMYGSRQFASFDQGWIGWFCQKAIEQHLAVSEEFTISGNGKQVRDILHASDMVDLYYNANEQIEKIEGKAYNIGGTMEQSMSLLELFDILNNTLRINLKYTNLPARISDQKVFVADINKIRNAIGWQPRVTAQDGIKQMLEWTLKRI